MKKIIITLLFLSITLFSQDKVITIVSDRAFGNNELHEMKFRVLQEALKRLDYQTKHILINSSLGLQRTNDGFYDMQLYRVYNFHEVTNNKYKNLLRVDSVLDQIEWIAVFRDDLEINKWEDLKPLKVGYVRGIKFLENKIEQINPKHFYEAYNDDLLFKMFEHKRFDVVILHKEKSRVFIFPQKSKHKVLGSIKLNTYIHKKHKDLNIKISQEIDKMKKDGSFEKIKNLQ